MGGTEGITDYKTRGELSPMHGPAIPDVWGGRSDVGRWMAEFEMFNEENKRIDLVRQLASPQTFFEAISQKNRILFSSPQNAAYHW